MIKHIFDIIKIIIAILPFFLLCFYSRKVNLGQADRSKQLYMPVVALIYVTVSMLLMNLINGWILQLIDAIPRWIRYLSEVSWMPSVLARGASLLAQLLRKLFQVLNMNFWVFFISNTVIIIVYLMIKGPIIKFMSKKVNTDGKIFTKIATTFYDYFPEKNVWCLKENYSYVRSMLKVFYYSAVVLSALLMVVSRYLYFLGMFEAIFYPVFGIIVLGELYFYLDGTTKKEYTRDILGEDEEAYRTVNYSLLRKFLRSVFGDKLLTENTNVNNALAYDVTIDEIIGELEQSEDPEVVSFSAFLEVLNRNGFQIDHNYLYSSLDLIEGKSVLFNNPFYNDLVPYAFYPMNKTLMKHQKVLVVLGRHSIEEDIKEWLERGIESVTSIPFLWNIGVLNSEEQDLDIGIVTRSDVLDIKLHEANAEFLENVGFVVIIEPSKLISTAQIGLNLLVKKCKTDENKNVVFCMCDKNCDGLVDAMSHVLLTSITEVSATHKPLGTSSYMCWGADDEYLHHRIVPNISRYLGVGTELSFAALKNQVSLTKWYGGDAFPVTDINWIDKQYYFDLTKYANLPTNQDTIDEHFITTSNFWSAPVEKNNYFTVEDEAHNMFEILRDFSTRTTEQGFINVISSDYLLKDYMADNASIFETDAKAIPFICADYTRSNRNTVLRLILMMSTFPVSSDILEKEMSLLGIKVFDLKKQLWYEMYNCYSDIAKSENLPEDYKAAVKAVYSRPLCIGTEEWSNRLIRVEETFNMKRGKLETTYSITDKDFLEVCVSELRSAGYVSEDEKGQKYYLGAELCGHIYQKYLPGQFFTFGGKYYEMQYLTADGQVLVRRAADHINGRPTYRQIREYVIHGSKPSGKMGSEKEISGMRIVKEFADITVNTSGYYEMERYNDFTTAKRVSFDGGKTKRTYYNKEIIKIELPDLDGKLSDSIRYTVTVMFNEVFRTLFAENQAYICAVTDDSFISETKVPKPLTYSIRGDGCELCKNAVYIIEDSQLDLGLTVAVERNLQRIFGIIQDYLDWHTEKLEESLAPPPEPPSPVSFDDPSEEDKPKKKGFFGGIIDKIKGWFKRKPKKDKSKEDDGETPEETPDNDDNAPQKPDKPIGDYTETDPIIGDLSSEEGLIGDIIGEDPLMGDIPMVDPVTGDEVVKKDPLKGVEMPTGVTNPPAEPEKPKKKGIFGWFGKKDKKKGNDSAENGAETAEKPEKKGLFGWLKRKKKTDPVPTSPIPTPENGELPGVPSDEGAILGELPIGGDVGGELPIGDDGDLGAILDLPADITIPEVENMGESTEKIEMQESPAENEIETEVEDEVEHLEVEGFSNQRRPYHERFYMLFGGEAELPFIDLNGTFNYLSAMKANKNTLKQARNSKKIAELIEATFKPGKPDARYCDFCGAEIYGVEYETLADGRDRCLSCGRTAIKTGDEFRKIFEDVKRNMEAFFGIRINAGIKVEMVNAKTLHKKLGKAFVPTPEADGRVLGVAINDKNGYTLMVENGSPRIASMLTMAHELTHIWQYINWKDKDIVKKYGKNLRLEVYEGMAKWVEIQYAYLINEPAVAKREEIITSSREDEYGQGFLRYRANYPFSLGTVITKRTPFMDIENPLDEDYCGTITVNLPTPGVTPTDIDKITRPGIVVPSNEEVIKGPSDRDPQFLKRYAYGLLNDTEKKAYDRILGAINNFEPEVSGFEGGLTEEVMQKIVDYVQRDHPELIWFRQGATFLFNVDTRVVTKIEFVYCLSRDEAGKRMEKIKKATDSFLECVNDEMSDYETALRIYENIIKLVDYDTIGLERQKRSQQTSDVPDDLRSIYGVMVNKKAVCAGYAKTMQYLLNLCGIECTYVTSNTHAWNMLKLEGDYYFLDVTWGDGSDTKKEKNTSDAVRYDYFCITTEELSRLDKHSPEDILPLPVCTATGCNYHKRHGLFFDDYDFEEIMSVTCEKVKQKTYDISYKFADEGSFEDAKKQLVDGSMFRDVIQYVGLKAGVKIDSSYKYSVNEESYILSFYMTKL